MGNAGKIFSIIGTKLYRGFILEKDSDPAYIDHRKINSVLVVVRHRMGDMLCALPMIQSVRNMYPSAKIVLLTKESARFDEIFKGVKSPVDEVIYYENGLEKYFTVLKELQQYKFDAAVVPSTVVFSGTNHLFAYHSHAKLKAGVRSIDFEKNPVSYLLNLKNDFRWGISKTHQVERNLDVIRQLKIEPSVNTIRLELSKESKEFADSFFAENFPDRSKKVIGFHPGAGKETNVWPAERFAELAFKLKELSGGYLFISEGPSDKPYSSKLKNLLIEKYGITDAVVHNGKLMNNAAIINMLNLFITNDTGVMHIASGLKTPLIALFGETSAYEWGPAGDNKYSIQSPNGKISGIDVNTVFETGVNLLK